MGLVQRQASEGSPVPQSRSVRLARNALRAPCVIGLVLIALLGSALYATADEPPWVEPRALNIVDIAGQVPDWVLENNIVAFSHIGGLAQFMSSERDGGLLRISVRLRPRAYPAGEAWTTAFTLLGHRAILDHMGSSVPEMWVRLYDGDTELTSHINWGLYIDPALSLPLAGSSQMVRYPEYLTTSMVMESNGLKVPANYGGEYGLNGDYADLSAVFTVVQPTNSPQVTYLGYQEATYRSYIGDPDHVHVGAFQPLMEQLWDKFGDRHDRITLNIPSGANYVMFTYPPTPFSVYQTEHNLQRPDGGTVRLSPGQGMLSQDLTHGGAFPLAVAWQDAGQVLYDPYLSLLCSIDRITPPEHLVLEGTPYDPCFLRGDCDDDVLKAIYDATATIRIIYLQVEPTYPGLQALSLKVADDSWSPALAGSPSETEMTEPSSSPTRPFRLHLPLIFRSVVDEPAPTPTVEAERPVGFLDPATGRMVGYWPE